MSAAAEVAGARAKVAKVAKVARAVRAVRHGLPARVAKAVKAVKEAARAANVPPRGVHPSHPQPRPRLRRRPFLARLKPFRLPRWLKALPGAVRGKPTVRAGGGGGAAVAVAVTATGRRAAQRLARPAWANCHPLAQRPNSLAHPPR